jgi:hypothetical protein
MGKRADGQVLVVSQVDAFWRAVAILPLNLKFWEAAPAGRGLLCRVPPCLRDSGGGESAAKRASETAGEQVIGRERESRRERATRKRWIERVSK